MHTEALGSYEPDTPVTNSNREEFVELFVKNLLEDRIKSQYDSFAQVGAARTARRSCVLRVSAAALAARCRGLAATRDGQSASERPVPGTQKP